MIEIIKGILKCCLLVKITPGYHIALHCSKKIIIVNNITLESLPPETSESDNNLCTQYTYHMMLPPASSLKDAFNRFSVCFHEDISTIVFIKTNAGDLKLYFGP